jgi:hypothetical protein
MKNLGWKTTDKARAKARAKSSNDARAIGSKNDHTAFLTADKWLEHLEEEIEPTCLIAEKEDLNLVLENSSDDFETLESLKCVRAAVKSTDDVAMPESGHYYDALYSKIMAAIDDDVAMNGEPVRDVPRARRPLVFSTSRLPQALLGAFGMTMMVAILSFVGMTKRAPSQQDGLVAAATSHENVAEKVAEKIIEENFERKIAMVDSHSGATFAREMGSYESEEDFLTETAAARLKQVSVQQADTLLRSLTR